MNSRVNNPESYIFSAIIYIDKDNFTSNDVAQILIERFSLPKSYLKAKAFAYNQIQCLVRKGLLNKVRKTGAYQYVYSITSEFNVVKESIELIEAPKKNSCQLVSITTNHEHSNANIQIRSLIEKYSSELEKVSGAKEIYEELIIVVPSRENEFRKLSLELEKQQIKINEKINTLIGVFNKAIAIRQ
jgi:predicted transcriptional regulator